jgi:hypothetical protein
VFPQDSDVSIDKSHADCASKPLCPSAPAAFFRRVRPVEVCDSKDVMLEMHVALCELQSESERQKAVPQPLCTSDADGQLQAFQLKCARWLCVGFLILKFVIVRQSGTN